MNAEQQQMVTDNIGLAYSFADKFYETYGGNWDEWRSESLYILTLAATTYNPSKRLFSGYAGQMLRWELSKYLKKIHSWGRNSKKRFITSDCLLEPSRARDVVEVVEASDTLRRVLAGASAVERKFCQLRMEGMGSIEIAEKCGVTRQAVTHAFRRIRERFLGQRRSVRGRPRLSDPMKVAA